MVEPPLGDFEGLPAMRRFAAEVASWPEVAEDWQWCARFLYQVVERRGTGGGNFRRMYFPLPGGGGLRGVGARGRGRRGLGQPCPRRPDRERA